MYSRFGVTWEPTSHSINNPNILICGIQIMVSKNSKNKWTYAKSNSSQIIMAKYIPNSIGNYYKVISNLESDLVYMAYFCWNN